MQKKPMNYFVLVISAVTLLLTSITATADTAAEIDRDVDNAIQKLYARSSVAKELSTIAKQSLSFRRSSRAA
jgi:hypothetical protein